MGIPNLGPKFVSGSVATGKLRLYRDDGTDDYAPVLMFLGTVTDVTANGILDVNFPGGS